MHPVNRSLLCHSTRLVLTGMRSLSSFRHQEIGTMLSPKHFGKNFYVPPHNGKLALETKNPHLFDGRIEFESENHSCKYQSLLVSGNNCA